jgi:hypothetical protein
MGPLVIVAVAPTLQSLRLRLSGMGDTKLRLHNTVHLLVGVVVDEATAHELYPNPQAPPPQAQAGKPAGSVPKKGHPKITAHDLGAAKPTE